MLANLKSRVVTALGGVMVEPAQVPMVTSTDVRAFPLQSSDTTRFLFAPKPEMIEHMLAYAVDVWVRTAVAELATDFASAPLEVWIRGSSKLADNHPLTKLLGPAGKPNADQDRYEFLEESYSNLRIMGNAYWYWYSKFRGAPTEVYNMPPNEMFVRPGSSDVVGNYSYWHQGLQLALPKSAVTHFREYHPANRYYGLSAMETLRLEVSNDQNMARWNNEFFSSDVFSPAGILFVPVETTNEEIKRIEDEMEGKHGKRRRTMVIRVPAPGSQSYSESGLKHRELEFKEGRLLSRQAVYEVLGLPLGLYSESSTEAHARVAERQKLSNVYKYHVRFATKIDQDVLPFWPDATKYKSRFVDVRKVDWQMEKFKLDALSGLMTVDEIREQELQLPPMPVDETPAPAENGNSGGSDDAE